jgi:hypothetical protein
LEGSNLPSLLIFDSVNQTIPYLSTVIARGAARNVGMGNSSMYCGMLFDGVVARAIGRELNRRPARISEKAVILIE